MVQGQKVKLAFKSSSNAHFPTLFTFRSTLVLPLALLGNTSGRLMVVHDFDHKLAGQKYGWEC